MTGLATATFPDGSMPDVHDVALIAANLFSAGGETTARLLGSALQLIAERPELQQLLRDERDRIPGFIEEMLRLESPIQGEFRLSRVATTVGGVDIPAGTTVMVHNGAANRDPRQFDAPTEFRLDRANGRQHLGFGFGIHTCVGAPLARAEARVSLERLLDRMADIRISARRARSGRRPPLRVLADLHAPRPGAPAPGVHTARDGCFGGATLTATDVTASPDDELRDELRAWLHGASAPRRRGRDDGRRGRDAAGVAADAARGPLGRHPLAGRVRRAGRVADAGRDLQRGARPRRRAAAPRARRASRSSGRP